MEKFKNAFENLMKLDDIILDKASNMAKSEITETKKEISDIISRGKPSHFTDEQW